MAKYFRVVKSTRQPAINDGGLKTIRNSRYTRYFSYFNGLTKFNMLNNAEIYTIDVLQDFEVIKLDSIRRKRKYAWQ